MSTPSIRKLKGAINEFMTSEGTYIAACKKIFDSIKKAKELPRDPKIPQAFLDEVYQTLQILMGCAQRFDQLSKELLKNFGVGIEAETYRVISPPETHIQQQYGNLMGFIEQWMKYIDFKMKDVFFTWFDQYGTWEKLVAQKSDYMAQVSAALGCDFAVVFQRPPRYDLLSNTLVGAIQECLEEGEQQTEMASAYQHALKLNEQCKAFAFDINVFQGCQMYHAANPKMALLYAFMQLDDVQKKKARDLIITAKVIQENRTDATFFGGAVSSSVALKDCVIFLRNDLDPDGQEYGTIILSAPVFEPHSTNDVVQQIARLCANEPVVDANKPLVDGHLYTLQELIAREETETVVYSFAAPMEQTASLAKAPVLENPLPEPRKILVVKANLTRLGFKIPAIEQQPKGRRRSSLGEGKQHDRQDNIIQIFDGATKLDTNKVMSLRFPDMKKRTRITEMIVQLCSNTAPREITQHVPGHRRRGSLFGRSDTNDFPAPVVTNTSTTTVFVTAPIQAPAPAPAPAPLAPQSPTNASATEAVAPPRPLTINTARTAAQQQEDGPAVYKPVGRVPTPLAGLDPSQLQGALKRPADSQPRATKRRSRDNFTAVENQEVSLDKDQQPKPRAFGAINSVAANGSMVQQLVTPSAGKTPARLRSQGKGQLRTAPAAPTEVTDEQQGDCNQQ